MIKQVRKRDAVDLRSRERHQAILERLNRQGACTYQELAEALAVSSMTIRRDINELAERGVVIKTLGGAQKAHEPHYLYETPLYSRFSVNRQEKQAIAAESLQLIDSPCTIFMDGGSTCLELARLLAKECKGLTLVTNSALACLELGRGSENLIVGIGGQYDANSLSFVGPQSEDWAQSVFVDMAFVSTKGFVPAEGTFESSVATFRIKQIIARQCRRLVLLVDHSKFGQRALSKVLDHEQIHTVVTDDGAPEEDLAQLRRRGREVIVASVNRSSVEGAAHGA